MIKEVALRFEIASNSFKDGNLLLYNKDRGYFYAISPEMILQKQDSEIKKLKEHYTEKEQKMKEEVEMLKQEVNDLKQQYNNFLISYQETNAKLLEMVESFIKNYGGNN